MNRRHALATLALAFSPLVVKGKGRCVSAVDRWRPDSRIPVGFCTRPAWMEEIAKAADNWNQRFAAVHLNPVPCVQVGEPGVAVIEDRIVVGGVLHHGAVRSVTRDRDGYITQAVIGVNTTDFYQDGRGDSSLMCHEIGHALGEGHDPESYGGCMARKVTGGPLDGDPDYPGPGTVASLLSRYAQPESCRKSRKKGKH